MLASLTGLVVGERPVARAQVERSVEQRSEFAVTAEKLKVARMAQPTPNARDAAPCIDQGDSGQGAPIARSSRSILLLKRAWLE